MGTERQIFLNEEIPAQFPSPKPGLRMLDKLVGTWDVKGRESGKEGEINGQVTFEWMDGGFFLRQTVAINHIGTRVSGIEIIGYERNGGADDAGTGCTSHFFDNFGNHFEYVWEANQKDLTIWGGYVGSPAYFKGQFSDDNNVLTGTWKWPGGGYRSTMKRISAGPGKDLDRSLNCL